MQMSYLYEVDVPFKNFFKLARHAETIRKNVWEKSNDAYLLSIGEQTALKQVSTCFFTTISTWKKVFFFRALPEKGSARHIETSSVVWTVIDSGKVANQIGRLAAIIRV